MDWGALDSPVEDASSSSSTSGTGSILCWSPSGSSSSSSDHEDGIAAGTPAPAPSELHSFLHHHGRPDIPVFGALQATAAWPANQRPDDQQTADLVNEFLGVMPHRGGGKTLEASLLGMDCRKFEMEFEALASAILLCSRGWFSSFCLYLLRKLENELVPHLLVSFFMADETVLTSGGHRWQPGDGPKVVGLVHKRRPRASLPLLLEQFGNPNTLRRRGGRISQRFGPSIWNEPATG
jgi:hypothetical protein